MNDKLHKLIDLLIEYSESGMFLSDLNYRLKEIKADEKKTQTQVWNQLSQCCDATFHIVNDEVEGEFTVCDKCGKRFKTVWRYAGEEKPWLPNPGDGFFTIHPAFNKPDRQYWGDPEPTMGQLALWKLGLVFKTYEEAEAKINSLIEK